MTASAHRGGSPARRRPGDRQPAAYPGLRVENMAAFTDLPPDRQPAPCHTGRHGMSLRCLLPAAYRHRSAIPVPVSHTGTIRGTCCPGTGGETRTGRAVPGRQVDRGKPRTHPLPGVSATVRTGQPQLFAPASRAVPDTRLREEIAWTRDLLNTVAGRRDTPFRAPYGEIDPRLVRRFPEFRAVPAPVSASC